MSSTIHPVTPLVARVLGGPTIVLEYGGVRMLTDPTFDPPGTYDRGRYNLIKTEQPAAGPGTIGPIEIVLLSHDHHPDNLDTAGRAFLAQVPLVLTTVSGAQRLGQRATPLPCWSYIDIPRPAGGTVRITGVPAQHGPDGTDDLTGEVIGFVLTGDGLPSVYISGDNASLDIVRTIVDTLGPVEIAILFAGAAQSPLLGDAHLTLTGEGTANATLLLQARRVLPVHVDSWGHFSEDITAVQRAFTAAGLSDRLVLPERGTTITL